MSLNKPSQARLLLPKVLTKPSTMPNSRIKLPDQTLSRTISRAIENLTALQTGKAKFTDLASLIELSQLLVSIAMQNRNEQNYFVNGYKAQQEIKYLKLKIRTLEADLLFRQEQVIKLQNRIKAMSDFYSKECNKPRPKSPAQQFNLGLSRIKGKFGGGELSQIVRSEYGIANNKSPTPRLSSQIYRKQNTSPERLLTMHHRHLETNSTEGSTIQGSLKQGQTFLAKPLENSRLFTKKCASLKASKQQQTQPTDSLKKIEEACDGVKENYERRLSQLSTKNRELAQLVSIYKQECFELTERSVGYELGNIRHSLSVE